MGCLFLVQGNMAAFVGMKQQRYRLKFANKTANTTKRNNVLGLGVISGN